MKKLLKSAHVYRCDLPSTAALAGHLNDHNFVELGSCEYARAGFVETLDTGILFHFEGGIAFTVRYDEKIIPAAAVTKESNKRIKECEMETDERLPREIRNEIREQVFNEFLGKALVNSKELICFYVRDDRLLIVPTTSKELADVVISLLVRAIGSIKTETIHIDGISNSMTAKIEAYLNGQYEFEKFKVCDSIKLKSNEKDNKKSFSFKSESGLEDAKEGILEVISSGAKVTEVELENDDLYFRVDKDFVIKGINFIAESEEVDFEDSLDRIRHEMTVQVTLFKAALNDLAALFEYKEPTLELN